MEEISMLRALPRMKVIVPCDFEETRKATHAAAEVWGPVYIRFGRENVPVVTSPDTPFVFGKGLQMREGGDIALIACGVMVYEALEAAEALAKKGVEARVIDLHTIKPIDRKIVLQAAEDCGAIVTAEEHQIHGGLGGAVAEVVVRGNPVPMEFVAVDDRFGQSGTPDELMAAFGLKSRDIVAAADRVLRRKMARVF
jgi:transketolase